MNGITYFRLNSSYDGDITKNCALTGSEVDNNFYTLEGRDIKSIEIQDGKVVVNLLNGEKLSTEKITGKCIENLEVEFDTTKGELTITKDGEVKTISGFVTYDNVGDAISQIVDDAVSGVHINGTVYVDSTINGNGSSQSPIGVSSVAKTGQYRPVSSIVNTLNGEKLPSSSATFPGDRYLTVEKVNDFGFLYNYEGLKKIACSLKENGSLWRVPTKDDWDDMLNAIEPKEDYRTHSDARSNKYLGEYAGKFLKTKEYWKKDSCGCDSDTDCSCGEDTSCATSCDCNETYCGEMGSCHCKCSNNNGGIDKYGFKAIPSGYANEGKDYLYFKERAYFWTASNHEYRDAYVKILAYNKSSVLQDIMATDNYMSVRLIKDYNGTNFNEREDILGDSYSTVLMPSLKNGSAIWTDVNISVSNCNCDCNYILPNDGEGMEYTKRFFTNEWNGTQWIRKEILEGETVVALKDGDKDHVEYCVVNGELVSTATKLYNDVYGQLDPQIKEFEKNVEVLKETVEETDKKIVTVNENLVTSINNINNNVAEGFNTINKNVADGFNTINEAVDVERKRIDNVDERLTKVETDTSTASNLVHIQEGSAFDKENGLLTLKSQGGTNDINIQFDFNFGTF